MSKKLLLAASVAFFSYTAEAQLQDSIQSTVSLDEIVVTASKIPLAQRETAKPVQVITKEQIEASEGKDLAQLLNEESGIIVNGAYGNPGRNKDIFVRGASSEYTLFLIDGIPVTDVSGIGGALDLRLIPLQQIERIEILKGSQSTLYGSDAIAGVINIITQQDSEQPFSLNGSLSAGSLNTTEATLGIHGKVDAVDYQVSYSRFQTEGITEALDNVDSVEFDKDGFLRHAFQGRFGWQATKSIKIVPFIRHSLLVSDYDGGSFTDADNTFYSRLIDPGFEATYEKGDFSVRALYNYINIDREYFSAYDTSTFKGYTHNADLFASHKINSSLQWLAGIFYQSATVLDDQGLEENPSYRTASPYITFLINDYHGLNLELGYRLNNHSTFGNRSTFSIAPSYHFSQNISGFASYTHRL